MAGPWEKYQNAAPAESPSDGPWTKYQQPQQSPQQQGGDVVSDAEQRFGIPAGLLGAVISKESSGNANAMSGKGAIGLTQVMPNTARGMGYDPEELKRNPAMQVEAGARYLKQMIDAHDGNVSAALAAYNWGPGNVQKYLRGEKTQVPTETVNYVNDPRFAPWTQQVAPGSDDELAQLSQQSAQPWAQQAPAPTASQNIEQAARGVANIPFDILQGGANLVNAGSRAVGGGDVLDPVYRPVNRPTDPYAQAGEAIGAYLTPGVGPVAGAMIGSVSNAGNEPGDFATNATNEMLLNAALLGAPAALRGIRAMSGARTGATQAASAMPAAIETANDVSNLARTAAGRDVIAGQAANVTDDIARAAETAGVDINALTPGMRSGSRGVAQAEGALASTPGVAQDAHQAAFNEIASKFNQNLDDLGAAAGTASEKSSSIKQRIMGNLDEMKNAERAAWDDVRATMPNQKMSLSNANAVIQGERSAGVPLSPEMKQLLGANRGGVTFDGMKAWRAKFADAEQKYIRSGEANAARRAGEVRRAITDDMRNMAEQGGFIDDWTRANDLSKARLTAQENAESIFGRGLANDVLVTNGVKALQSSSAKGLNGPSGFHSIISSLPEAERVPAISSILQDAISHGVRGGKSDAAGINHIATLLTPQNVNAINRYSKDLGRIADAYGTLARAAVKPQQYVERTGRTTEVLKALDSGLPKIAQTVLDATGNSTAGAVVGATGGGVIGATVGATAGAVIKSAVAKISKTRSGRYAIEKAIQEATRAVKSGATPQAVAEAERRFLANKVAVKAIRDAVGSEEFERLSRAGIVAALSGIQQD
ncbi:TPA: lytic transglycosylase domain-containing protein [Serratia marcescens]